MDPLWEKGPAKGRLYAPPPVPRAPPPSTMESPGAPAVGSGKEVRALVFTSVPSPPPPK